jgi:hypothetical protein
VTGSPDPIAALALLDEPTRGRLYELVAASHDEVSRDQAAQALGISRELAAFHLDRLAEACAADGRSAFLFAAPPVPTADVFDAPINPLAIK